MADFHPLTRSPASVPRASLLWGTVRLDGASDPTVFSSEVESATRLDSGSGFFTRVRLRATFDFNANNTGVLITAQVPGFEDVKVTTHRLATPSSPNQYHEFDVVVRDTAGLMITTADIVLHFLVLGSQG